MRRMKPFSRCLVYLLAGCLAAGNPGATAAASKPSAARGASVAQRCCCGTKDGRCCALACCRGPSSAPARQTQSPARWQAACDPFVLVARVHCVESERSPGTVCGSKQGGFFAPSFPTLQQQAVRLNI